MWFNIIKDTEDDRLRALGYPVPKKVSTSLTRDKIIDYIKTWADNEPQISPFDEHFEIVRTQFYTVNVPAKNKTILVVEATTDRTDYFKEMTHDREWNRELAQSIPVRRRNDTMVGRFFVAIYEIGSNRPTVAKAISVKDDIDLFLGSLENTYLPRIRAGGFYASIESTVPNAKISSDGLLRITGESGTDYKVDLSSGDCKVTAVNKEVTFEHHPELNTRVTVSMCVHLGTGQRLPLGDKYAQMVLSLSNDTSPTVPNIIQLFGRDWNVERDYRNDYIKTKLEQKKKHITEGSAVSIINSGEFPIPW
jgi:hypothetical protein